MKLIIFTSAIANGIQAYQSIKTLSLDGMSTTVQRADHTHCNQSQIPNELENGIKIMDDDLQCEILNQHSVCSTTCEQDKRIEFECHCNREFMFIVLYDINACHWKTIIDAPCFEDQTLPMLNDVTLHEDNSPNLEAIESEMNDYREIPYERLEPEYEDTFDIEFEDQSQPEIENQVSATKSDDGDSTKLYETISDTTERHIPTCMTLDKTWNCSNSNLIR